MGRLPFAIAFTFIGLLAFAAAARALWTGRLPVFFTSRPDIERASEPRRFWIQFIALSACGLMVLAGGLLLFL
jgi:hypothetical protein